MASEQSNKQPIVYKIDKNFAYNFDVIQNIKVGNRKSSQGFSDENKLMLSMRDGTTRLGNEHTGGEGTSGLYFFTDFLRTRHKIKGYNNRVWYLNSSSVWTDLGVNFSGNLFNFNTVRLPLMLDGTSPTEYTTPANATGSEFVKKSASDTGGTNNIGKILLITDNNTDDKQAYRGCFGTINGYDNTTEEYILGDSGIFGTLDTDNNLIGLKSGSKYKIFDTLGEHLQVTNGVSLDRYFFGKSDGTIVENTNVQGFATYGLRNIQAITSFQFIGKQINYSNSYFSFNKGTLFYTSGNINNPFFHTYINSLTIPGINGGDIKDIFIFKDRLIIAGNNFSSYINSLSELTQVKSISTRYGMKEKSLVDMGEDSYFISSNKNIYSLSETISGTLKATNIGKQVKNYLKNFNTNICSGFDGDKLCYYGQLNSTTQGILLVLDIEYKFWSIYTGLRPSSIVSEDGVTYLTDNNSDIVRYFDSTTILDVGAVPIEQKLVFNEIYLNDVFTGKVVSDIWLWLDNYNQDLYIDTFMAGVNNNGRKQRLLISIQEVNIPSENLPMGEGDMGETILGGEGYESDISFPFMRHIQNDSDSANIWKVILTGKDGSPFYLNECVVEVGFDGNQREFFSPIDTI